MIKTFKYRLAPTRKQTAALQQTLELCRNLYNCALEQRRIQRTNQFAQMRELTEVRAEFAEYRDAHVHVLQNTLKKLNRAFDGFFRRVKAGQKPGFPRFKGRDRFDSFAFNDTGFKLSGRYLQISRIGAIKLRLSRPIPSGATIKALTVKRRGSNWYACFAVECPPNPLPANDKAIGIDMGIENFAALSNGKFIPNPRIYEQEQARLRRAQRRVARRKKGSHRRRKAAVLLRKIHERIANHRLDFLHKESTKLVREYGTIGIENLNVAGLAKGTLAKQVHDASWARFIQLLTYKAADAGRRVVAVDPKFTSHICSRCGYKDAKNRRTQSAFKCLRCGFETNADFNASVNILARIEPSGVNEREPILA
jgi:putative transposase